MREDNVQKQGFAMNYKDVEQMIRIFYGSHDYAIEQWIQEFED